MSSVVSSLFRKAMVTKKMDVIVWEILVLGMSESSWGR